MTLKYEKYFLIIVYTFDTKMEDIFYLCFCASVITGNKTRQQNNNKYNLKKIAGLPQTF